MNSCIYVQPLIDDTISQQTHVVTFIA